MIIDLSFSTINYDIDIDPDQSVSSGYDPTIVTHLTKEKWVVVKAAKSPSILNSDLSDNHIHVDMIFRIQLDEDNIWLIPLSSIVKPCFVVYNKNYTSSIGDTDPCEDDNTAYIVRPMKEWSDMFMST